MARNVDDVTKRAVGIVAEYFEVDRETVNRETNLAKDLGMDSSDELEVVMGFEEDFDINIPDDALDNKTTVGDWIDYLVAAE